MSMRVPAVVLAVALAWVAIDAQQEVRTTPGPGSGTMKVTGAVEVTNTPTVEAVQGGPWRVSLVDPANVRLTNTAQIAFLPPGFLQARGRYTVTWPGGERETVTIEQVGGEGWVRIAGEGRARWINVAVARSIEDAR